MKEIADTALIRVVLPFHLRALAHIEQDLCVEVGHPPTLGAVLDAVETRHPVLRGTIRDYATGRRRPFLRFYACQRDFSNEPLNVQLPEPVVSGKEPLFIIGAIAGG